MTFRRLQSMMLDPHHTLGVRPTAGPKEIREAYCRLVKRLHPDLSAQDSHKRELLQQVIAAYMQLKGRPASAQRVEDKKTKASRPAWWAGVAFVTGLALALFAVMDLYDRLAPSATARLSADNPMPRKVDATDRETKSAEHRMREKSVGAASFSEMKSSIGSSQRRGYLMGAGLVAHSPALAQAKSLPHLSEAGAVHPRMGYVPIGPSEILPFTSATRINPTAVVQSTFGNTELAAVRGIAAKELPFIDEGLANTTSVAASDARIQKHSFDPPVTLARTIPFPSRKAMPPVLLRWKVYRDSKFGISISYPKNLLPDAKSSLDSRDRLFTTPDGDALLRVSTERSARNQQLAQAMRYRIANRFSGIPVETELHDTWYLLRGTYGGEHFIERLDQSCSAKLAHRTLLVYPAARKLEFAAVADRLASSRLVTQNSSVSCASVATSTSP